LEEWIHKNESVPNFVRLEVLTFVYNVQMMEEAVHFLGKETIIQAVARSATKVSTFTDKITWPYFANMFILFL